MHKPCQFPFYSLTVTADGGLAPCCAFTGDFGRIKDISSIAKNWQSDKQWTALRNSELAGQWTLPGCGNCKNAENQVETRKERYDKAFGKYSKSDCSDVTLKHLDLSFGNTCNLACVMCGGHYSSTWVKHEVDFRIHNILQAENKNWSMPFEKIDELADLVNKSNTIESIEIKGGEPLFDKRVHYFLEKIAGYPGDLHMVTNFTVVNEKTVQLLQQFPRRSISVSIDGIGETYEWARGFSFKKLEDNLINFLPRIVQPKTIVLFNFVTTVYNLHKIEEFWDWVVEFREANQVLCLPDFSLVALTPSHVSPRLSSHKEEALSSLASVIAKVQKHPRITERDKLRVIGELQVLIDLLRDPMEPTQEDMAIHQEWHARFVKMRGWDINKKASSELALQNSSV